MITPEFVAQALDWPTIELYDERTALRFTAVNNEAQGSTVVVELREGTWGIKVGDVALCTYVTSSGYESWAFEANVTAIVDGVSVTLDTIPAAGITAGDTIVFRPTFFPADRVQFVPDTEFSDNKFILPPFGLDYTGSSISAANSYGPKMDVFQIGTEPGLMAARLIWHEFGVLLGNPNS